MYNIQVDSKNAILELLKAGKAFEKIYVADNAFKDSKSLEILKEANKRDVQVIKIPRRSINRKSRSGGSQSIVGFLISENSWSLDDLLTDLFSKKQTPFFLILDHIKYAQNLGAIFRTAFASGVNGVILPVQKKPHIDSEVTRISMGTSERIPVVEMSFFNAMKVLNQNGIKVTGLTNEGKVYYKEDLTGPVAFVIGSEDAGISPKVLERVDNEISIPMREGIGELNTAVGVGVICYEKLRQEVS